MSVNITARGPEGHRDFKHFYREGLDVPSMRILIEALHPLLPDDLVYTAADEQDYEWYGVLASDVHPDRFNVAMTELRRSGSAAVKGAIAKIGDAILTELGAQSQRVRLEVRPYSTDQGRKYAAHVSTDGSALDEPMRNMCINRAQDLYLDYGLSEPDGQEWHVLPAVQVLAAAEGRRPNALVPIATWAIKTFGPEATVCCH